jgi:hypothetical protein
MGRIGGAKGKGRLFFSLPFLIPELAPETKKWPLAPGFILFSFRHLFPFLFRYIFN